MLKIKSVKTEIHISDCLERFQKSIIKNIENYALLSNSDQEIAFKEIWNDFFGIEDHREVNEYEEIFSNLYYLFRIECITIETKQIIHSLFSNLEFDMNLIIDEIRKDLLYRFQTPFKILQSERLVYPLNGNQSSLKEMVQFDKKHKYEYLCGDSLYKLVKNSSSLHTSDRIVPLY